MTPQCHPLALPHPPPPLASCAASPSDPASLSFSKVFRDFRRKKRIGSKRGGGGGEDVRTAGLCETLRLLPVRVRR